MRVSGYLCELVQSKATVVMLFLKFMLKRDAYLSHFESRGPHAAAIALEVADLVEKNQTAVYRAYGEWRAGGLTLEDDGGQRQGAFFTPARGSYERHVFLHEEDLKTKFKNWKRKNLGKFSKELAWRYLNETLLKQVDDATLRAHNICLPISKSTALL